MPVQKVIGTVTYTVPTASDRGWAQTTTAYLLSLGTYANQVAKSAYDLTTNFKLNSPVVVSDSKNVASYGLEAPFVQIRNYNSSSQAKFGAVRLPIMGATYNEVSSTNTTYTPTGVSAHNQINWALTGGYIYLHSDNHATLNQASLVIQRLSTTNSPITVQADIATQLANDANFDVDSVVLRKAETTLKGKTLDLNGSNANIIKNTAIATAQVALWEGTFLTNSAVTKNELGTLSGINTGSTVQTRLAALESSSTTATSDLGNIGSLAAGLFAKTTNNTSPTADVYTSRTLTGTANKITITNGDGVSGNPTFTVGSDIVTLTDTQTLSNKTISVSSNTVTGTASRIAQFNVSGNLVSDNALLDNITFPNNKGIESASVSSTLNIGTTSTTTTLNLGTSGSTSTVNIGTGAGATTINIGGSGDTVNIAGTLNSLNTTNTEIADQTITINKGGTAANTAGAGLSIEGGGTEVGYLRSDSARTGTEFKSEQRAGTSVIKHSTASATNVIDLSAGTGSTYTYPAASGSVLTTTADQTITGKNTFNTLLYIAEAATVTTANLAPTSTPPRAIQRITTSSATLGTITNTGGSAGTELILINATASAISVLNDSGASSTSILTGTGSAITLAAGASLIVIYDLSSSRWRVIGGAGGSGSGSAVTNNVNFGSAHGFAIGDWLYLNGTTYTKSINTSETAAQAVGVVTAVIDTNNFTITTSGVATGLSGLTAGAVHYVASTAGTITATKPILPSQFEAPVGIAISTTSMYVACRVAEPTTRYTSNNEQPVKNYLRPYADATVAPTISTATSTGNITVTNGTSNFYTDTGTSLSVSTNSSLRGTTNYLTAVTSSSSSGTVYVQFPAITLDGTDSGKPVSVSFDVTGNTTSGDWDAVIAEYTSGGTYVGLIPIAGTASTCSVTPSALLPTGTTTLNGFFVPSSGSSVFALRLRRLAGSVAPRIDTLFIGPQPIRVGAAITDWQSYTPTGAATNATYTGKWRRAGDSIECLIDLAFTASPGGSSIYYFSYAQVLNGLGLTVDTSKLPNATDVALSVGTYTVLDSGTTVYSGLINTDGSGVQCFSVAGVAFSATSPIAVMVSGDNLSLNFRLPITGWSSNVTMADRSVEEYLWNSATADSSDTTSFGYGPSGVLFGSFTASTRKKRIRSTTGFQPTDVLIIEVQPAGSNAWNPISANLNGSLGFVIQSGTGYGIFLENVNSTDIDVCFSQYSRPTGATYGAAGEAWSTYSTWRWRVRKVSAGAQVGYPISSSNIIYQETCNVITGTATVSASPTNVINLCNSGSAFTITISAIASTPNGTILRFKNIGAGNVTLDPNASETIDGQTTWPLSQYSSVELIAFNGAWYVL